MNSKRILYLYLFFSLSCSSQKTKEVADLENCKNSSKYLNEVFGIDPKGHDFYFVGSTKYCGSCLNQGLMFLIENKTKLNNLTIVISGDRLEKQLVTNLAILSEHVEILYDKKNFGERYNIGLSKPICFSVYEKECVYYQTLNSSNIENELKKVIDHKRHQK